MSASPCWNSRRWHSARHVDPHGVRRAAVDGRSCSASTDPAAARVRDRSAFFAESGGPTVHEQEHAGTTIHVDGGDRRAYAVTDDQLILAPTADDVIAALDAHASGAATLSGGRLDERGMAERSPDDWLAFGIYDFTDLMAAAPSQAGGRVARDGRRAGAVCSRTSRFAAPWPSPSRATGSPVDASTDAPTGPFAASNADRGLADEVPGDALYYAEGGNIGTSLGALIGPIKDAAAAMPGGAEELAMVEAALGADLEEFVAWIGDGAMAVGWDGERAVRRPGPRAYRHRRRPSGGSTSLPPSRASRLARSFERDQRRRARGRGVTVTAIRWSEAPAEMIDPTLPVPARSPSSTQSPTTVSSSASARRFVDRVLGPRCRRLAGRRRSLRRRGGRPRRSEQRRRGVGRPAPACARRSSPRSPLDAAETPTSTRPRSSPGCCRSIGSWP